MMRNKTMKQESLEIGERGDDYELFSKAVENKIDFIFQGLKTLPYDDTNL